MKIFKKRAIAILIDSFMYTPVLVMCDKLLELLGIDNIGSWGLLLIIPFLFKDLIFRNASIGKKIMGIVIYDNDWKSPSIKKMLKRSALMYTIGYVLLFKHKFVDGQIIHIFDWERNVLGTRVIDKKVFKELEFIAKNQDQDFSQSMTELYNKYLRDLYFR